MGIRGVWATPNLSRRRRAAGNSAAWRGIRHSVRSRRWLLIGGFVTVCLLYSIALIASLLIARHDMLAGVSAARRAENDVQPHRLTASPQAALIQASSSLLAASADFHQADSRLTLFAPLLRHLSWIPAVGGELAASPTAAKLGEQTAGGGYDLLRALQPVLGTGSSSVHLSAPLLLRRLNNQEPRIGTACASLQQAEVSRHALDGIDSASLAQSLASLDRQLPRITTLCHTLQLLPGALGYPKPVSYLLGYLNPSQIRAGGGFLGSVGLLTLRSGKVSQQFTGTWLRDNLSYPPPSPIAKYEGEPAWLFRDSNWSPDFPTTAALERFFAHLDLGWNVQGVINVTPQVSVDALRALGSFYSPQYHRWITAGNVSQLADYYAHQATDSGPPIATSRPIRRRFRRRYQPQRVHRDRCPISFPPVGSTDALATSSPGAEPGDRYSAPRYSGELFQPAPPTGAGPGRRRWQRECHYL